MNKLFKTAFTLIELLVVIAIIGILSGLIVISMSGVTNKANVAKAQVFSNSLRNSLMLNLVSEWNFNNLTGTVGSEISTASNFVVDGWGSNTGTAYGSPVLKSDSDCITTKCLYFNGSTDYILFQGNNFNFGTEDFTIALWVKPEASTSYHHFFAMPTQATLALKAYGQNKNIYFYTPTFSTNSTITALYKENVWNYIVFTRRSSVAYIYLDGV
jgi:prepilin-type N-terminal cleavage/methylation domain-containing protein